MIIGIGIDVVEIDRFDEALRRSGDRLVQRLFSLQEQEYCRQHVNPAAHFAVRFCAKEAFSKAIGKGIAHGIQWIDVEVIRETNTGRPMLQLHRRAADIFLQLRGRNIFLSMTHSRNIAAANVVLEGA